jgi:transcriptional regulator with XRE-family HTH domain
MRVRETEEVLRAIGRRLAEIRTEKGLTQQAFADQAKVSRRYLQRLEQGKQNSSIGTLNRLAGLLGVPFEELLVPPKDMTVGSGRPKRF